jgi:hypothetical protein
MRRDELYLKNAKKVQWKEDGTFIAHAPITSMGVYVYNRENGTTHELRSYEEVFKEDSLKTLENLSITLHHPNEEVDDKNKAQYEVGRIIGNISHYDNDPRVYADLHITNKTAIKAALTSGVKFLSCGYKSKDLKTDGVFLGMSYDTIQTDIRYNHVSLCRKPRGDEHLMIKLDGIEDALKFDDAQTEFEEIVSIINNGENNMAIQKEDSGNSNAETIKMFADMQTKIDSKEKELIVAKSEVDKIKGEKDALQAKCDSLASELKSLQDSFPNQIHELAYKLSSLRTLVNDWGIEGLKADATEKEMKMAIISKHDKNFKADGKSEEYINARFDSTIEIATAEKNKNDKIEAEKKLDGIGNPAIRKDGIEKKNDPIDARKRMIASYGKKEG